MLAKKEKTLEKEPAALKAIVLRLFTYIVNTNVKLDQ